MGARNVKAVYRRWGHLQGSAFRLLVYAALNAPDEARPRCELSREAMAVGLGYAAPNPTADKAVKRAISSLLVADAMDVAQTHAPGRRAHYWLNLSMEQGTDLSPVQTTDDDGTGDRSVPCSTASTDFLPQEQVLTLTSFAPPPHAAPGEVPMAKPTIQPSLWPAPVADPDPSPQVVTAQTVIGEWIERCAKRPPDRVVGQVARHINEMLAEGIDPDDVRRGIAAWMVKGLHPAALASVVNEVMNRMSPAPRPSTTDQRVTDTLALGARLQAQHDQRAVGQ